MDAHAQTGWRCKHCAPLLLIVLHAALLPRHELPLQLCGGEAACIILHAAMLLQREGPMQHGCNGMSEMWRPWRQWSSGALFRHRQRWQTIIKCLFMHSRPLGMQLNGRILWSTWTNQYFPGSMDLYGTALQRNSIIHIQNSLNIRKRQINSKIIESVTSQQPLFVT